MSIKRKIMAKDVVVDVRAGLSNAELMEKYQLSSAGLQSVFDKLVAAEALLDQELTCRRLDDSDPSCEMSAPDEAARSYVMFRLPIYDLDDLTVEGLIHDISEKDLMVEGISVQVGEVKRLLIQADEFADVYPFTFDAICRSVEERGSAEGFAAVFEITSISGVGRGELRKLCRVLGLS
jgi:hypothetical protein